MKQSGEPTLSNLKRIYKRLLFTDDLLMSKADRLALYAYILRRTRQRITELEHEQDPTYNNYQAK